MPKRISGFELVKFLTKKGFVIYSRKGSHVKLISIERNTKTIVPQHNKLSYGTLRAIIKQSKISADEEKELFD